LILKEIRVNSYEYSKYKSMITVCSVTVLETKDCTRPSSEYHNFSILSLSQEHSILKEIQMKNRTAFSYEENLQKDFGGNNLFHYFYFFFQFV